MNVLRVALDVPTDKVFDYVAGEANAAQPGDRVAVPFGKRSKIGVVLEAGAASELGASRLKPIERVLDDAPRLPADWLEQMRFLAAYYQRPLGETVASALPPRLRSGKPPPKERSPSPVAEAGGRFVSGHAPNAAQAEAIARIGAALGRFRAFLLHGVTGSG